MMKNKEAAQEYMKSETMVFWDMNRCPIPEGYDACRVGPRIDSVLMSLGYSGPLTIAAIGDLYDTPHEVLRALSSSGVLVKEVCGLMSVLGEILKWKRNHPPPATVMLISDSHGVSTFTCPLRRLQAKGYNILMAYPHTLPRQPQGLDISAEWLWEPFLTDSMDSPETRRPEKKCSVEVAFTCNSCKCHFVCQSFEMFTDHLMSKEHTVKTMKRHPRKKVTPFTNKAFVPSRRPPPVIWDTAGPRKIESLEKFEKRMREEGRHSLLFPMVTPTPLKIPQKIYHEEILKEFENMVREPPSRSEQTLESLEESTYFVSTREGR